MEQQRTHGETLGYEIMNEPDIVWDGCHHSWTMGIGGTANQPTHWKLSTEIIRTFVRECAKGIREVLSEVNKGNKLVLCGIQTSSDRSNRNYRNFVSHEMGLLRPDNNNPPLSLSGSAITLYAAKQNWQRDSFTGRSSSDTEDKLNEPRPFKVQDSRNNFLNMHNGKCIMSEAGGGTRNYNCSEHAQTVSTILLESMKRGYAGVFIWHYNDPERENLNDDPERENLDESNALTESGVYRGPGISHFQAHNSNHTTHRRVFSEGRPATVTFRSFSEQYGNYIIPFLQRSTH
jgi:hypothetical protein